MKLRTKVLALVSGKGKKTGADYTKVKVLVEDGPDAQTAFVFWSDTLGKLPSPGDVVMGEYMLGATEFGDLTLKLASFQAVAAAAKAA